MVEEKNILKNRIIYIIIGLYFKNLDVYCV